MELLYELSAGAGIGLRPDDGRNVFMKFLISQEIDATLAVSALVNHLADHGILSPRVLAGAAPDTQTISHLDRSATHFRFDRAAGARRGGGAARVVER